MILTNILYTARVLAAWWLIRQTKTALDHRFPGHPRKVWIASVVIGAEVTFVADYVLFKLWTPT